MDLDGTPLILTDAKALAALANPHRSRILDLLRVYGPSTASALSERTDQAVGSVSHHLKVLAEAKIIEEAPELAKDRRERWWRRSAPTTRWSRADLVDEAAVDAANAAENLQLSWQFERTRAHVNDPKPQPEFGDSSFGFQSWLRMTPAELSEFAGQLEDLLMGWVRRDLDDSVERQPVLFFAHGFPTQP